MEMRNKLDINKNTKVLVSASSYDFKTDTRLLIPFTSGNKIGFVNKEGDIVVEPKYDMYYGDCFSTKDLIKVSVLDMTGYIRSGGRVVCYDRQLYGLINYKGEIVLDTIFYDIIPVKSVDNLYTVHKKDGGYAVIDLNGNEIVPYGKYNYIDGFDRGFARVKIGRVTNGSTNSEIKWGIINITGIEVLPTIYDNIWNFYDKTHSTIVVIKDGKSSQIPIRQLYRNNYGGGTQDNWMEDDYGTHYGEFEGSYAQDVMGYSDDVINDAFEGDPDMYWNID